MTVRYHSMNTGCICEAKLTPEQEQELRDAYESKEATKKRWTFKEFVEVVLSYNA